MSMRTVVTQNRKFYIFLHISPRHQLPFKNIYVPVKSYPRATFHVLVAKVYIVTGAHYVT